MTVLLSVDLASKLSAVVQRGSGGEVLAQFDSRDISIMKFAKTIAAHAAESNITVIEDVPYGVSSQAMTKPVLRVQGAILACFELMKLDPPVFVSPGVWMKAYPAVQYAPKGMSKAAGDKARIEAAAHYAREAGYEPPDLVTAYVATLPEGKKALKKVTNVLEKSMTDYVSAFLMSEFCRQHTRADLLALPGVSEGVL